MEIEDSLAPSLYDCRHVNLKLVVDNPCKDLWYRSPEEASSEVGRGSKFDSKKQKIHSQEWIDLGDAKWRNDLFRIADWKMDVLNMSEELHFKLAAAFEP